jgi:tRNA threonylcarbamoyladenosine biosynthesis protein TsaB
VILSLEATDRGGSIALGDRNRLLDVTYQESDVTHSERLMPTIDDLLEKRDIPYGSIDTVAVARGPGSFTAIRLAVTTAKTLSMVCDAELFSASTLSVLASCASGQADTVTAMIDARRGELYVQTFGRAGDKFVARDQPRLEDPEDLTLESELAVFRGRDLGWGDVSVPQEVQRMDSAITRPLAIPLWEQATDGETVDDPDRLSPLYVRKSDAQRSSNGASTS